MSMHLPPAPIHYPDSDGQPMADNSLQFAWIQLLSGNLAALFVARDDVVVGGDMLWYPVQGFPNITQAPDTFVIFGRPKGYRGSYKQWEEDDTPMTVVFEVRSPNDSDAKMLGKLNFYEAHGVEEYYMIDPESNLLEVYRRRGGMLVPERLPTGSYTSPRLGIRFDYVRGVSITAFHPDGEPFLPIEELILRVTDAQRQATDAQQRLARLAELSRRARRGQATPDELTELEQLENDAG